MVQQFAYIHEVVGISLLLGKKYKVRQYSFFFLSKKLQRKTLITRATFFYILCTGFTMGYKTGQKLVHKVQQEPYEIKLQN